MIFVADESRALIEDILATARARQEAIGAMKSWVLGFLATSRRQHRQACRETQARRCGRVNGLATETRTFLAQCDDEQCAVAERRGQAADEQRGRAADFEAARLDAFLRMHDRHSRTRDQIVHDVGTLAADTHGFLRHCDARRRILENDVRQTAWQLRQQLAGGDDARRIDFGRLRSRLAGRLAELRHSVRGHLTETRQDFIATRAAWRHLAAARSDARRTPRTW